MPLVLVFGYAVPAVVFVVSATGKLRNPDGFRDSLAPLSIVPRRLVRPMAIALTSAEIVAAVAVCWGVVAALLGRPLAQPIGLTGLVLSALLLVVLTAGIAIEVRRGSTAGCACFGVTSHRLGTRHLVRNALLVVCVVAGLSTYPMVATQTVRPGGALVALAGGLAVALILIRLDDLVDLFAPIPVRDTPGPASRPRS